MEILLFLIVPFGLVIGWIVGLVGFFRAGRALREVAALRRELGLRPNGVELTGAATGFEADAPFDDAAVPLPALDATPEPEPAFATGPVQAPTKPARDWEALLTLRWGLWLGALALLMAGVFLIRYAADQGLLGPGTRCVVAFLLGLAMLAGAEWMRRRPAPAGQDEDAAPDDGGGTASPWSHDQAPAALASGGVAILFGAAYGAGPFYALVPPTIGFALLAAASFAGMLISLRFGQLVAAVGIVGGFVTPLLVQTNDPSLPGLFAYLFAVAAAALAVVRYTAWTWLGWATTIACALWAVAGGAFANAASVWAPSLFVPATAALNLVLLPPAALDHPIGKRLAWIPFAALAASGLAIEAALDDDWTRAGLLLLIPLAVGKGASEPRLDRLPWLAGLVTLLMLLFWDLPSWQATGETVTAGGVAQAFLPGAFAPDAIIPFLLTAGAAALVFALAGLVMERRAPRPLPWAALPAALPVLTLAVAYIQVERFRPAMDWGFAGLAVAAALVVTSSLAKREGSEQRAGAHAAGAVAALALACAMLLRAQFLTVAISLFLPPLAWIEARSGLRALRQVALVVAGLVLIRLVLNWYVLDYEFGDRPLVNGLLAAYGLPAVAFALAARLFRPRGDDATVATLEAGSVLFASVLIALEIRHWHGDGDLRAETSLDEAALHVGTLAVQAYVNLRLARRTGRAVLHWASRIQGGIALAGGAALLAFNPMLLDLGGTWTALIAGYLLPAILAASALPLVASRRSRGLLAGYAVVAGFVWLMLAVRQAFHPGAMSIWVSDIDDAELWAWSGAGLAYGAGLMAFGIARQTLAGSRALRLAALAIIALMAAKVFLVDMAGLEGLWRVVSFLGLGLMLIGLGAVYRRFVARPVGL